MSWSLALHIAHIYPLYLKVRYQRWGGRMLGGSEPTRKFISSNIFGFVVIWQKHFFLFIGLKKIKWNEIRQTLYPIVLGFLIINFCFNVIEGHIPMIMYCNCLEKLSLRNNSFLPLADATASSLALPLSCCTKFLSYSFPPFPLLWWEHVFTAVVNSGNQ